MTAGKSQAQVESRPRCPHDGKLLDRSNRCWMCGKTPEEWGIDVLEVVESNPQVDVQTGEVRGQLMLGLEVPRVAVQRKAETLMDESTFNRHYWSFGPGDKLAVAEKDGKLVVKLTTKGEE